MSTHVAIAAVCLTINVVVAFSIYRQIGSTPIFWGGLVLSLFCLVRILVLL